MDQGAKLSLSVDRICSRENLRSAHNVQDAEKILSQDACRLNENSLSYWGSELMGLDGYNLQADMSHAQGRWNAAEDDGYEMLNKIICRLFCKSFISICQQF